MKSQKFNRGQVKFKYTVETGWREVYEFCDEQKNTALTFAQMAVANRLMTESEIADGKKPTVTITIEEVE